MKEMNPVDEERYEINVDIHGIRDGPRLGRLRVLNKVGFFIVVFIISILLLQQESNMKAKENTAIMFLLVVIILSDFLFVFGFRDCGLNL